MFTQFLRDRRGNIAIMSSIMMTSLVGVSGLAAEFGSGLLERMQNQRLADAAAIAGAEVYATTKSSSDMTGAVSRIASLTGSSATVSGQLVTSPSGDGNEAIEVTAQSSVPMILAQLLWQQNSLPVSVTAYAEMKTLGPGGGSGCILALDPTASKAISFSGSGNVQAPNCDVISNSSSSNAIDMSGAAHLTTPCTISVGGQTTTSGLDLTSCKKPYTGAPSGSDPYGSIANPTETSSATCLTVPSPPTSIPPGYYCSGISISGSGTATFQSGFYYVKGNLSISGSSTVSGTGVTFFVDKSGTTSISGSSNVTFSAPTSGTYSGILFFGDRNGSTSNSNNISGSSSTTLTGALYYPTEKLTYSGSSSGSTCTQVIADTITFTGSTEFGAACSGAGVSTIDVPGTNVNVALVQ